MVDQAMFAGVIVLSVLVLIQRRFKWGEFIQANKLLTVLYMFLLLSCLWSIDPVSTIKRTVKDFGCVVLALLLLTESEPWSAIRLAFARVGYVVIPLSLTLMKYYPSLGRSAFRAGDTMYVGVATQKNTMGLIALVFSLLLMGDIIESHRRGQWRAWLPRGVVILLGVWTIVLTDSQTSLLCLVLGAGIWWGSGFIMKLERPREVLVRVVLVSVSLGMLEVTFGLSGMVLESLGRDRSLTGRTEIWGLVQEADTDPILGSGFYSFWETPMARPISERFPGRVMNTAHNGYLEMYLDGGVVGVALLVGLLTVLMWRTMRRTIDGEALGRVGLVVAAIAVIYNVSETDFFRLEPLWFSLLLTTIEYQGLGLGDRSAARLLQTSRRRLEVSAAAGFGG